MLWGTAKRFGCGRIGGGGLHAERHRPDAASTAIVAAFSNPIRTSSTNTTQLFDRRMNYHLHAFSELWCMFDAASDRENSRRFEPRAHRFRRDFAIFVLDRHNHQRYRGTDQHIS